MRPSTVTLVLAFGISLPRVCPGQTEKSCFAFLLRGDVMVTCYSKSAQITHRGNIEGFAVGDGQSALAYTTSRVVNGTQSIAQAWFRTTVIDLKSGSARVADGVNGALSTCGGLLSLGGPGGITPPVRDLISGQTVAFPPYYGFRCSADRSVVAGATKGQEALLLGLPPTTKVADARAFSLYTFNMSPDGSKIAYEAALHPLCVFAAGGTSCTAEDGSSPDAPSVNDAGEVLIGVGTGKGCFYKSYYDFSPKPSPGATHETQDECLGIGYWKPGLESVKIIEPLGRAPQWIRPETAELLRAWSARSATNSRK